MNRKMTIGMLALLAALITIPGTTLASEQAKTEKPADPHAEQAHTTSHSISVNGHTLRYKAVAGTLTLTDPAGAAKASMFYVAYLAETRDPNRPVTFFYNGGPGSSSIWLHMGSFGPVRVDAAQPGHPLLPPYGLKPNQWTLLDQTDMVFLDAIGTGYSHTFDPADNKLYWGHDQDSASFAEAIAHWLTLNDRWNAPKFLFGESYGTMRSAILADKLLDKGIDLNGIVLLSSVLNFAHMASGLDERAITLFPSYAAIAWYHDAVQHTAPSLAAFVQAARVFARGPYAAALAKGQDISGSEQRAIAEKAAAFIGISPERLMAGNLRIMPGDFRRELLRTRGQIIGAIDARYLGTEAGDAGEAATFDPSNGATQGAYLSTFNHYIAADLGWHAKRPYVAISEGKIMSTWDWSHQPPHGEKQISMADVTPDLSAAMRRNPRMQVLSLNGYFDLSTPFFATEFDLSHLYLSAALKHNLEIGYYPSGHMLYVDPAVLGQLRQDLRIFYIRAIAPAAAALDASDADRVP